MSQHYKVPITTYVLYSGNIRKPMTELKEGENRYRIIPIIMRDKNADRLIEDLEQKVKEGEDLSRNDLVPLSLCLLMGGKMALVDRVKALSCCSGLLLLASCQVFCHDDDRL